MPKRQQPSRFCRTPEDFEEVAAEWLRYFGFADARRTKSGPDGGIDVIASGAMAQVKAWMTPIGSPEIQQLKGVAHDGRTAIFFSLTDYTASAQEFARKAEVALFRFAGYDGTIEPYNGHARNLLAQAAVADIDPAKDSAIDKSLYDDVGEALRCIYNAGNGDDSAGLGDCVIISLRSSIRYVQFSASDGVSEGELLGESVSDEFLPPEERLTHEQLALLATFGWQLGTRSNFSQIWNGPSPVNDAIPIAVATLVQVHGVRSSDELKFVYPLKKKGR